MKHDHLPIRSPNHHGTDRRFYRAVPEQEDEAVNTLTRFEAIAALLGAPLVPFIALYLGCMS